MKLAVYLLFLQAFFLLYYYVSERIVVYLLFGVLNFVLAWAILKGEKRAIKITLAYKGLDLFFSILMLMSGVLSAGISGLIDFLIIHDLVGLFGKNVNEPPT
ncbi:hypothetical protein [Thermococcus paralvinellae]|uniref:Uncharacterized protein n=1 Tax=Thermococcus paralvinellae TaxID=582419 RepID=W0I795_9EURY|nr:hypothetical protein [Thermococcus paralvinellae]AHF80607.1 Hypothetical protein TES1_1225 [Thermococcus paralvinellae]